MGNSYRLKSNVVNVFTMNLDVKCKSNAEDNLDNLFN